MTGVIVAAQRHQFTHAPDVKSEKFAAILEFDLQHFINGVHMGDIECGVLKFTGEVEIVAPLAYLRHVVKNGKHIFFRFNTETGKETAALHTVFQIAVEGDRNILFIQTEHFPDLILKFSFGQFGTVRTVIIRQISGKVDGNEFTIQMGGLPGGSHLQFSVGKEFDIIFFDLGSSQTQLRGEEVIHGIPVFPVVSMVGGTDKKFDLVAFAQHFIEAFDLFVGLCGAADIKEVILLSQQQQRTGGIGKEQVPHFTAVTDKELGFLFGTGGLFVFHIVEPGGDIAAGSNGKSTVIHRRHKGTHVAAAGVAGNTDPLGIDLRTGLQIVVAADSVPDAPGGVEFTHKEHLFVDHIVFKGGTVCEFLRMGYIHQLSAFPLTGGVGSKDDKTVGDQIEDRSLVGVTCLAVDRVSGKKEHGGSVGGAFGDVQIGGNGQTGTAVVDHIFHTESITLQSTGDPGGKRRLFCRELERLTDLFFQLLLIGFELLRSLDLLQTRLAFCGIGSQFADIIVLYFVSKKLLHDIFSFFRKNLFYGSGSTVMAFMASSTLSRHFSSSSPEIPAGT